MRCASEASGCIKATVLAAAAVAFRGRACPDGTETTAPSGSGRRAASTQRGDRLGTRPHRVFEAEGFGSEGARAKGSARVHKQAYALAA